VTRKKEQRGKGKEGNASLQELPARRYGEGGQEGGCKYARRVHGRTGKKKSASVPKIANRGVRKQAQEQRRVTAARGVQMYK
jgi:hypothetical protein